MRDLVPDEQDRHIKGHTDRMTKLFTEDPLTSREGPKSGGGVG